MTKTEFKRAIDFLHKWQYELELMDDATPGNSLAAVITALQICSGEHPELVVVPIERLKRIESMAYKGRVEGHKCDADVQLDAIQQSVRAMIAACQADGRE